MATTQTTGTLTAMWHAAAVVPAAGTLPVPPATDRATWDPITGTVDRVTVDDVLARAQADRGLAWPWPAAHAYARYWRDGNRTEYEDAVAARQQRLSRAVLAAASTLDPGWVDEVADGLTALCEQSTWCWAAHDDTRARHGSVVPTVDDPFVDLGAGEVVAQLAWADHLLADLLDERYPGLRDRIRREARVRVLDPFLARRDWHWLGLDGDVHNWNPWIHGNVLVAALQLVPDDAARADLLDAVVGGLDRYLDALPADGAIDEGYAYWWNGACRALEAVDLLARAGGGRIDARQVPALVATVAFPHSMHLGADWFVNVGDGPARDTADQPWQALHRAARTVGDADAAAFAAWHRRPGRPLAHERDGLGRLLRAVVDTGWSGAAPAAPPLPRDVWLPSVQVMVARTQAGATDGPAVAVKGGHNGEHHNHLDVGTVVVAVDGVPVVVDAGRPTYTAQTFGPDRYRIWTMQSAWHDVPQIAGVQQAPGSRYSARDVTVHRDDDEATWTADLAGAYPGLAGGRWWRTVRLRRGRDVLVTEHWELDPTGPDGPHRVHLLLAGDLLEADADHARLAALDGAGTVRLDWTGATDVHTTTRALDDPLLTGSWGDHLTRLTLTLRDHTAGQATWRIQPERTAS